jgi:hypothetical protein
MRAVAAPVRIEGPAVWDVLALAAFKCQPGRVRSIICQKPLPARARDRSPGAVLAAWRAARSGGGVVAQAGGADPGVSWVRQAVSLIGSMPGSRPSWLSMSRSLRVAACPVILPSRTWWMWIWSASKDRPVGGIASRTRPGPMPGGKSAQVRAAREHPVHHRVAAGDFLLHLHLQVGERGDDVRQRGAAARAPVWVRVRQPPIRLVMERDSVIGSQRTPVDSGFGRFLFRANVPGIRHACLSGAWRLVGDPSRPLGDRSEIAGLDQFVRLETAERAGTGDRQD